MHLKHRLQIFFYPRTGNFAKNILLKASQLNDGGMEHSRGYRGSAIIQTAALAANIDNIAYPDCSGFYTLFFYAYCPCNFGSLFKVSFPAICEIFKPQWRNIDNILKGPDKVVQEGVQDESGKRLHK